MSREIWKRLKSLKRLKSRNLTVSYRVRFRGRQRKHEEDSYAHGKALQWLAELQWLHMHMDLIARLGMITCQFLNGLDNHDLQLQAAMIASSLKRGGDPQIPCQESCVAHLAHG